MKMTFGKAVDEEGLETERRCFKVSTTELFYTNIHEMAQAYLLGTAGMFDKIFLIANHNF